MKLWKCQYTLRMQSQTLKANALMVDYHPHISFDTFPQAHAIGEMANAWLLRFLQL